MAAGFSVFIDESGDEGFKFPAVPGGDGSSEWLVLSAVVVRASNEPSLIKTVADVRVKLGKRPLFPLHFRDLKHEHRIPWIEAIAAQRIRVMSVLVHKASLAEPEKFKERYRLYFYTARYLLERVSWVCRDAHALKPEGDGSAKITFSNRSKMPYQELRDYVALLVANVPPLGDVRIDPSVIKPEQIDTKTHDQIAGLQVADAVASSFYFATQIHRMGHTEPRYAVTLSPVLYRHKECCMTYGIKFWPKECDGLIASRKELAWVEELRRKK